MDDKDVSISIEIVATKILLIRGKKVMLDRDLARLYKVETKQLVRQVKRNIKRFPEDFMYQLNRQEFTNLKCQNVTSSWGGVRKLPYVFTEQGVAMLSGLLNSNRAIEVNIAIMRAFVKIREVLVTHKELAQKLQELEQKYQLHEKDIQIIFEAIKQLLEPPKEPEKPKIGF